MENALFVNRPKEASALGLIQDHFLMLNLTRTLKLALNRNCGLSLYFVIQPGSCIVGKSSKFADSWHKTSERGGMNLARLTFVKLVIGFGTFNLLCIAQRGERDHRTKIDLDTFDLLTFTSRESIEKIRSYRNGFFDGRISEMCT